MPETFTCEIQSRIYDVNRSGHVDSVAAIRVLDEARMRFFGATRGGIGTGLIAASPEHVIGLVASQQVNYRTEMRFANFQPFVVRMWVGHIGRTSFTVESELRLSDGDHPVAIIAETGVTMWSNEHHQTWEHSPEQRAELERYLAEPVPLRERPSR